MGVYRAESPLILSGDLEKDIETLRNALYERDLQLQYLFSHLDKSSFVDGFFESVMPEPVMIDTEAEDEETVLSVPGGGTGQKALEEGSFLVGNGSEPISSLTPNAARNAMGLGDSTGVLAVPNGGTGRSTLTSGYFLKGNGTSAVTMQSAATARNSMGLGNTTGALAIANGGTGATTATAAANNLCESGTWTPKLKGYAGTKDPTWSTSVGFGGGAGYANGAYLRMGRIVFVTCSISGQISNAGDGYAMVQGFPYAPVNSCALDLMEVYNCVTITSADQHPVLRYLVGNGLAIKSPNGTDTFKWKANNNAGGFLLSFSGSFFIGG